MLFVMQENVITTWLRYLTAGTLILIRLSGVVAFAPPFNSPAIALRIKAALAIALTVLMVPVVAAMPKAAHELSVQAVMGEVITGAIFGVSLAFLNESLLFAGSLMGISFSFSLANLMDPNSQVETPVIGTLLAWVGTLVLLAAGLHRILIASTLRSFAIVPIGSAWMKMYSVHAMVEMAGGIFIAGMQLAAPILTAAIVVEVSMALIGRVAPSLPVQVWSIPVKTLLSYTLLIGSLAIWPRWIEAHFMHLLDAAQRMVAA